MKRNNHCEKEEKKKKSQAKNLTFAEKSCMEVHSHFLQSCNCCCCCCWTQHAKLLRSCSPHLYCMLALFCTHHSNNSCYYSSTWNCSGNVCSATGHLWFHCAVLKSDHEKANQKKVEHCSSHTGQCVWHWCVPSIQLNHNHMLHTCKRGSALFLPVCVSFWHDFTHRDIQRKHAISLQTGMPGSANSNWHRPFQNENSQQTGNASRHDFRLSPSRSLH